jgi:hypothetical protein
MKTALIALAAIVISVPAFAQENTALKHRNVFVLGGPMGAAHMGDMFNPFGVPYENSVVIGGGYQQFFAEPLENVRVGLEVGAAVRSGEKTTGELWGGVVTRYDGFAKGDGLRISPSVTFGVSVVDDTMGVEAARAAGDGLPGDILFYLSPEISLSSGRSPDTEIFWRLHHRSGAWNSFGGGGSANATTIGVRTSF